VLPREPGLTTSLSPNGGEGGRRSRGGLCMVPIRAQKRKEASHEPPLSRPSATLSPPCGERAGRGVPIWFMAPTHVQFLEVFASDKPYPLIPSFSPNGGGGARRGVEGEAVGVSVLLRVVLVRVVLL